MNTALVTGGASGIGRAIVQRLRSDGHQVAIVDLSPTDEPNSFVADVTDPVQVQTAVAAARDALGPIAVLVNSAGLERFKRFTNLSFEDWSRVVDVNLNGVFHTIAAVLPGMVDSEWGRIVEEHIDRTPVRRVGKPEDIAAACASLISPEAGYITGQILGVNGGRRT